MALPLPNRAYRVLQLGLDDHEAQTFLALFGEMIESVALVTDVVPSVSEFLRSKESRLIIFVGNKCRSVILPAFLNGLMLFFGHGNNDRSSGHRFHHRFVLVVDTDSANKLAIDDAPKVFEVWRVV